MTTGYYKSNPVFVWQQQPEIRYLNEERMIHGALTELESWLHKKFG